MVLSPPRNGAHFPLFRTTSGTDEIPVVDLRGIFQDIGGTSLLSDLVFTHLHGHGRHPGHRLDRAGVDLIELSNPIEDEGELLLEPASSSSVIASRARRAMRRTVARSTDMTRGMVGFFQRSV